MLLCICHPVVMSCIAWHKIHSLTCAYTQKSFKVSKMFFRLHSRISHDRLLPSKSLPHAVDTEAIRSLSVMATTACDEKETCNHTLDTKPSPHQCNLQTASPCSRTSSSPQHLLHTRIQLQMVSFKVVVS
jgi:hypothetical protein